MRLLPGAVNLIVTIDDGQPYGMTATAVCSLSVEPPTLLVCVNRSASSHEPIRRSGRFSTNLVATVDEPVARAFSAGDMASRFQHGRWLDLPSGGRVLASALVACDCRLIEQYPVATHTIFVGAVEQVFVDGERAPLLYFDGRFCALQSGA
jgi:flavin reductase